MITDIRTRVVEAVIAECDRQDAKWGLQDHPDPVWAAIIGEEFGEACQALLHDLYAGPAAGTLRDELVQIAAVAVQWVECIDRRVARAEREAGQ